jgi:hypothetical protein
MPTTADFMARKAGDCWNSPYDQGDNAENPNDVDSGNEADDQEHNSENDDPKGPSERPRCAATAAPLRTL